MQNLDAGYVSMSKAEKSPPSWSLRLGGERQFTGKSRT